MLTDPQVPVTQLVVDPSPIQAEALMCSTVEACLVGIACGRPRLTPGFPSRATRRHTECLVTAGAVYAVEARRLRFGRAVGGRWAGGQPR